MVRAFKFQISGEEEGVRRQRRKRRRRNCFISKTRNSERFMVCTTSSQTTKSRNENDQKQNKAKQQQKGQINKTKSASHPVGLSRTGQVDLCDDKCIFLSIIKVSMLC